METDVRPNLGEDGTLVIRARGGEARGYPDGGVFAWKGMPYAAAPVGERRFRAPQPAQSWDGGCATVVSSGRSRRKAESGGSDRSGLQNRRGLPVDQRLGPRDPTARRDR